MVKQFDVIMIDLDPARGKEKQKYRPCVIVSNNFVNQGSPFVWALPITNRTKRFPSDIVVKTKRNNVTGIIDSIQIRALDIKSRNNKIVDELDDGIKSDVINTIIAHSKIL
ncbi:type II toxin-antitoxin system PemK/MazF family toxin [Staphylococcus agnetis]|uniref:type II toxin-antitoxin system PemK/MazF family toxin n=1 Tax=Staphylococcus agnetis TaxID=985762 RepID=UPI00208EA480|nr:type II toxin-antitoxin system PemK/MazF family toxin [Staphylococcus agnetis]MCO4356036.1 type II toxin-antitoxin system PemK/MazF family toxin [Staphylococcus agnetis]MCO4365809.1 type II toxin-antitoxin system PemK/MazF family toxin [Staphylococcus agnetis]